VRKIEIDAPGDGRSPYATEDEVCEFLGCGETRLGELTHPETGPYRWVRTRKLGQRKQYHGEDVAIMSQMIDRVGDGTPPPGQENDPGGRKK